MKSFVLAVTAAALMLATFASAEAGQRCRTSKVGNAYHTNCY